jgi:hypothetical protein
MVAIFIGILLNSLNGRWMLPSICICVSLHCAPHILIDGHDGAQKLNNLGYGYPTVWF